MHSTILSTFWAFTFLSHLLLVDAQNKRSWEDVSMKSQYSTGSKSKRVSKEPLLDESVLSNGSSKKKPSRSLNRSRSQGSMGSMRGASSSMMMESGGSYRESMGSTSGSRGSLRKSIRSVAHSKTAQDLYALVGEAVVKEGIEMIKNRVEEAQQPVQQYPAYPNYYSACR